jgi:hypothetical protein
MKLYDCVGIETGKVKDYVSKGQLLIECFDTSDDCKVKFFNSEFSATPDKNGIYSNYDGYYFEFDPKTGKAQGVTLAAYHYFNGHCKER